MEPSKTTVITFAGSEAHEEMQEQFDVLYAKNFKRHVMYNRGWLESSGCAKKYDYLFSYRKYYGYFIWKPLIILDALRDNESVLYCDSNLRFMNWSKFVDSFNRYNGVYIPRYNHYYNKDWTKRDAFVLMDADRPQFWNANQIWSVIMGFQDSSIVQEILQAYLGFCSNQSIVTELPNIYGENLEGFIAHRWEQSVMSVLVEKYGVPCPLYNDLLGVIDKVYPKALLDIKVEVDKDPLKKIG